MKEDFQVQSSIGNVFADLGLANSEELLIKAELIRQITNLIAVKKLTQSEAAEILGVDRSIISELLSGKLLGFSTESLFRFLNALGSGVEIRVISNSRFDGQAKTKNVS